MPGPSHNVQTTERTIMAVLIVLLLLLSPVSSVWADLDAPWYSPYLAWALAIFLSWLLQRYINRHEL